LSHEEAMARWNTKSRMNREIQVRFREGLGVKFPRPTRLKPIRGTSPLTA